MFISITHRRIIRRTIFKANIYAHANPSTKFDGGVYWHFGDR